MPNSQAPRDNNQVPTLLAVDDVTGFTVPVPVDSNGNLLIAATVAGSSPGGSSTQVQYNNAGAFGGITGATTDGTTLTLVAPVLGAATATSINGNVFTAGSSTYTGTAGQTYTFPTTSATIARTDAANTFTGVQTMTSPALTTPAITGLATGSGVSAAATASTLVARDANANITANDSISGWTTTATAAGTTTMTIASTPQQFWTGATTQTVKLPTTGVAAGQRYTFSNQSTGLLTVQSSGANTVLILAAGTSALFTALVAAPTAAADWGFFYAGVNAASGKVGTFNAKISLSGTDSTTMTFPTTSATIARTDAAQTFTGVQTFSSAAVLSSGTVTVSGNTVTFPTTADTLVARATTDTLTNKRVTKRTGTTTSSATPTINTDSVDFYSLTAQTVDITSFTTNLSGTPTEAQTLWIAITGTAARAITWGTSFEASTVALPTTTVTTARLDVGFVWNTVTSKWRCVATC